jgi:hypothetical protein
VSLVVSCVVRCSPLVVFRLSKLLVLFAQSVALALLLLTPPLNRKV